VNNKEKTMILSSIFRNDYLRRLSNLELNLRVTGIVTCLIHVGLLSV
jgi:hypothetical protein